MPLGFRQCHSPLTLVLASPILVRGLTNLIRLKEQHLRHTFIGVNFGGQRRGIGKFESYVTFPLGFQRRHIDDNTATGIGGLAETNSQYVSRDAKKFNRTSECKRIGWNNADIGFIPPNTFGTS